MAQLIIMPKFGLTMTEGIIAEWNVAVGDSVAEGDILCEIETDKLTNDFESPKAGVILKIIEAAGSTVTCLEPIAIIGQAGEDISAMAPAAGAPAEDSPAEVSAEMPAPVVRSGDKIIASPLAKKLAKEMGLDLSLIAPTGAKGNITADDVRNYTPAESRVLASPVAKKMAADHNIDLATVSADGRIMKKDLQGLIGPVPADSAEDQVIVLKGMRKTIAKRMTESWTTSPRVTYTRPLDASAMKALRTQLKPEFEKRQLKLTFNHLIMKACAQVLMEFPSVNGSMVDDTLLLHPHAHIGLAIGLDAGLLVPHVKYCDQKSLAQIAAETEALITDAKAGRTDLDSLTGATFTITNLGAYGITSFSPIINQPELAILGVNAIVDTPVVIDGQIVIRPMMSLSLTADHRIIDGMMAAQFLSRLAQFLETPALLMV